MRTRALYEAKMDHRIAFRFTGVMCAILIGGIILSGTALAVTEKEAIAAGAVVFPDTAAGRTASSKACSTYGSLRTPGKNPPVGRYCPPLHVFGDGGQWFAQIGDTRNTCSSNGIADFLDGGAHRYYCPGSDGPWVPLIADALKGCPSRTYSVRDAQFHSRLYSCQK